MSSILPNYLRAYRKQAGFSQAEMAFLLGCRSGAKVSRYERFSRQPNLQTIFIYEVVFRVHTQELFAGMFRDVERTTLRRARALVRKLQAAKTDPLTARKLEALTALIGQSIKKLHDS